MRTTKINTGLYWLHHKGRVFQIENIRTASDGEALPGWMVYEMTGSDLSGRAYCNDYATKRAAIARRFYERALDAIAKAYAVRRSPWDGSPYYCLTCGLGWGEYVACEQLDCKLETRKEAKARRKLKDGE